MHNQWGDDNIAVKTVPNPFKQFTEISVTGLEAVYDFELYDLTGRIKSRVEKLNSSRFILSGDGLTPGIYLFKIVSTSGRSAFGKLMVE